MNTSRGTQGRDKDQKGDDNMVAPVVYGVAMRHAENAHKMCTKLPKPTQPI